MADGAVLCPDCDDVLFFAFEETSGVGAWKRGDGFNTTPDTRHYICFPCHRTWKRRLDGPLTADVVGDLAFFSCRKPDCGTQMTMTVESAIPTEIELGCEKGHRYRVSATDDGGLMLVDA